MKKIGKGLLLAGFLLILGSAVLLICSRIHAQRAAASAAELTARLEAVLPPRTTGVTEAYTTMEMPAFSIGQQDFIGLVEIPAFQSALPLGSGWDRSQVSSFPCRFWGTVYDSSLIIGGSDQMGQFDFLDQIQLGDAVLVTDMTGAEFTYRTEKIFRSNSADAEILLDEESALTLFARDSRSFEYIIVRCALQS